MPRTSASPATQPKTTTVTRTAITDEVAAEVVRMYTQQGAKLAEITAATGVPRSSIYWILQKHGKEPTRQGTRRGAATGAESMQWAMTRIEELAAENGRLKAQLEEAQAALVAAVTRNG